MSSTRAALKAAKAALDAQNYDEVVSQAQLVLASDAQNYFAKLFLGLAQEKLGRPEEAIKTYESAIQIKSNDDQAWQGLRNTYESLGSKHIDPYITASTRLAEIYACADDKLKCQTAIDRLVLFVKNNGTKRQYRKALEVQLPTSLVYDFLEGRLPHPSQTYVRIAELVESEEKERMNKEIGERRTRLGARIGQVTSEVQREILSDSPLEAFYQNIIDWANDDDVRREYEEKLLQRAYDTLLVLPPSQKTKKREQVSQLAQGMVIIKHPFLLAWDVAIEWKDAESIDEWDPNVLWEYIEFFPESGLAKLLLVFLKSTMSPFEQREGVKEDNDGKETLESLPSLEDTLLAMTEAFEDAGKSPFAHRLMSVYYLHIEEYEIAASVARKGLELLYAQTLKIQLSFTENTDAFNLVLGTSLIYYQNPRNHPEARQIFENILERKKACTTALIGLGYILEEEEEYGAAVSFLNMALERDTSNLRIGAEAAWCKALEGDYETALAELERYEPEMTTENRKDRELRAQTLYRIGICHWCLKPSKAERKDRSGAYSYFLAAIKTNPSYAPAYTSLGIFYADYAKDKKRSRQCFQKAFELSSAEVEAAERLARSFADEGEWDIVEVIAQRVVDSGKVQPTPGSKRRGISWPLSALGVVQINKQEYPESIVSFLSALRINHQDYYSFVGLGESYHNSGRYNSAAKAFQSAETVSCNADGEAARDQWFTKYMRANVNRELGLYEDAINGYREVLAEREEEYGVAIALLQTYIEQGRKHLETGFFGRAADSSNLVIDLAGSIVTYRPHAFNLWKAVGDACSLFTYVKARLECAPVKKILELLKVSINIQELDLFAEFDGIGKERLTLDASDKVSHSLELCATAAILAYKRAIATSADNVHAHAVAWYNLGWGEWRAHKCLEWNDTPSEGRRTEDSNRFVNTAVNCFKRAIELEAGNAEFWNALGIVTAKLSPKVSQHSFVRSLHLNERNAHVWANLGALCLLEEDYELAHAAFSRAQSADPDYADAWLGEGFVALLWGEKKEAVLHFAHAFDISRSSSLMAQKQYVLSTFDTLVSSKAPTATTDLIQPLFALQQLQWQISSNWSYDHLRGLYLERAGCYSEAAETLSSICITAEAEYEASESVEALARFVRVKSDLARTRLAAGQFTDAVEDSQTLLDLTSEGPIESMSIEAFRSVRISAQLTSGLANYYTRDMDSSIAMFRSALEETQGDPDVVCLLAEVLWAKGGAEEKGVAKEQLFACIEEHSEHIGAVVLLGAIAVTEEDLETMDAVKDDLMGLRIREDLDTRSQRRIEKVLDAIAALISTTTSGASEVGIGGELLAAVGTSILLAPNRPHGWTQLASITEDHHAAQMALKTAQRAVPPHGPLDAEDLANAFASAGTIANTQRAIMFAPYYNEHWRSLTEALTQVA